MPRKRKTTALPESPIEIIKALWPGLSPFERLVAERRIRWLERARPSQIQPAGDWWSIWLLVTGRGFGKTRTGAEHIAHFCLENPNARAAVLNKNQPDCRKINFQGPEVGLLQIIPQELMIQGNLDKAWKSSALELHLINGSVILGFGAEEGDKLRGHNLDVAWCDEMASWPDVESTWDNLQFALRRGKRPHTVITTTPKPLPLLKKLIEREGIDVAITRGSTYDNAANLPASFIKDIERQYEGTFLGRQELYAELLEFPENSILRADWWRVWEEDEYPPCDLVVLSIDPAYGDRQINDPSAASVWGVYSDPNGLSKLLCLHAWEKRLEFNSLLEEIEATIRRWHPQYVLVEGKASGISVIQELRRRITARLEDRPMKVKGEIIDDPMVRQINPQVDKVARAHAVSNMLQSGLIYVPKTTDNRRWPTQLIAAAAMFPDGGRDLTDTMTQCWSEVRKLGLGFYRDEEAPAPGARQSDPAPLYDGL